MLPWASWFKTLNHYSWHWGLDIWWANGSTLQHQCRRTTIRTIRPLSNKIRRTGYYLAKMTVCHNVEFGMSDCCVQLTHFVFFSFDLFALHSHRLGSQPLCTSILDLRMRVFIWCQVLLGKHKTPLLTHQEEKTFLSGSGLTRNAGIFLI